MIKIGITGGIGSGKSIVSHLLRILGIPVYDSDREAKRLTIVDPYIRRELTSLFGEKIYEHGELNKSLLANYLFANEDHAGVINGIIHPRVKTDFREWAEEHAGQDIIALESAILLEAGFSSEVDLLVMVYAPLELRIQRTMKRDSCSYDEVMSRIRRQMDEEEKKQKTGYVIFNDDVQPLIPQVLTMVGSLQKR